MKIQFTSSADIKNLATIKKYLNDQGIMPPSDAALVRWGIDVFTKSIIESYPQLAFSDDAIALKYVRGIRIEDAEIPSLNPSSLISKEELSDIIERLSQNRE